METQMPLLLLLWAKCECECSEQPHVSVRELARVMGGPAASARFKYVETQSKHSQ